MFTIKQIKAAHANVKSGADFPRYIQEIKALGVTGYETYVCDGHTLYSGNENYQEASDATYALLEIAGQRDKLRFEKELKEHQQGKTDFFTFCKLCAQLGVEKWVVDMKKMTCSYYDKAGNELLVEIIPHP